MFRIEIFAANLMDSPSFMFSGDEVRIGGTKGTGFLPHKALLKKEGQDPDAHIVKGHYDRHNGIATFIDDKEGKLYGRLVDLLPPGTPHYIDGILID